MSTNLDKLVLGTYTEGRRDVKEDIDKQIDLMIGQGFMSQVNGIIALGLIKTYIKYMDED